MLIFIFYSNLLYSSLNNKSFNLCILRKTFKLFIVFNPENKFFSNDNLAFEYLEYLGKVLLVVSFFKMMLTSFYTDTTLFLITFRLLAN